jgi:hypothetical protein
MGAPEILRPTRIAGGNWPKVRDRWGQLFVSLPRVSRAVQARRFPVSMLIACFYYVFWIVADRLKRRREPQVNRRNLTEKLTAMVAARRKADKNASSLDSFAHDGP